MIRLIKRDLQLAVRAGGGFGLAIAFFLIVVMLVPFAIGPATDRLALIAPGILWIGALLACLLSLDRILHLDFEDGSLDLLATSPMPLESVVLGKAVAHWLSTGLPLTLIAPLFAILLNLPNGAYGVLIVSLALGTPALSIIGAFGAALTVGLKRGGLLMSLIVLPMYVPSLIFGAEAVSRAARGEAFGTPLALVAGVSLLALSLMPFATAAVLRANLR